VPEISIEQAIAIATQHHEAGRLAEAENLYRQILARNPNHDDALRLLGIIMMQKGHADQAVDLIRRAIAINPAAAQYHVNLGNALKAAGNIDAGIDAYREALRLQPDYPQAHYNRGVALADKGLFTDAIEAYRRALELKPAYWQAMVNLGVALAETGQTDEAIAIYCAALRVKPGDADAYTNLGNALRGRNRPDEAIAAYEQAIRFKPELAEAHWNLATLLLIRGDFERGQKEFEWRWRWKDFPTRPRPFAQPLWDGGELNGRTILLWHEQGLGDTIQFIRYAPLVAGRGGRVIVQCPPELARLMKSVAGIAQVVTGEPLPPFDVHCPMMSLPLAIATRVESIPANLPYLSIDPILKKQWRKKISLCTGRIKVGLVWAGSSTNRKDALRSISFSQFAPLAKIPNVTFFSLQKGNAAGQCANVPSGMELIDLTGELHDFADTAALVSHLDLVIAVDTAVAHLAGALGKQVWTLIPFGPDWRWLLDREDSPWYPTMRLFRQSKARDWDDVIERVGEAMKICATQRNES